MIQLNTEDRVLGTRKWVIRERISDSKEKWKKIQVLAFITINLQETVLNNLAIQVPTQVNNGVPIMQCSSPSSVP